MFRNASALRCTSMKGCAVHVLMYVLMACGAAFCGYKDNAVGLV